GFMGGLVVVTIALLPLLGREFMPELEEGNLWIRGTFPISISPEAASRRVNEARRIMQRYPESELIVAQSGRPDDGTDPTGFYNAEFFLPLRPAKEWPAVKPQEGWMGLLRKTRPRTKDELISEMNAELNRSLVGINWNFSQNIRDNVMEALS